MSRVVLDDSLARQLLDQNSSVELVDSGGRVVGRFVPTTVIGADGYIGPDLTSAELEEIARNTKRWYTTAEVIARLKSLE